MEGSFKEDMPLVKEVLDEIKQSGNRYEKTTQFNTS